MKTVSSTVLMFCGFLMSTGVGTGAAPVLPDPGPENGGLCLRLVIVPGPQGDSRTINMELLNTGLKAVSLVGEWDYEEDKGDYEAFFAKRMAFVTYPEVQPESFQTAGGRRNASQPAYELAPGKSLSVSWRSQGRQIRQQSPFSGTTPLLPSPGLYGVKATIVLLTKAGARVLLVSNEQPMIVGCVRTLPKYATGYVVSANQEKNLVMIDLGSDQKIEKGDTFVMHWGLQASWRLTVVNVETWSSEGTTSRLHHDGRPETPQFPREGWLATLEPKGKTGSSE